MLRAEVVVGAKRFHSRWPGYDGVVDVIVGAFGDVEVSEVRGGEDLQERLPAGIDPARRHDIAGKWLARVRVYDCDLPLVQIDRL